MKGARLVFVGAIVLLGLVGTTVVSSPWSGEEPLTQDKLTQLGKSGDFLYIHFEWGESIGEVHEMGLEFFHVQGEAAGKLSVTTGRITEGAGAAPSSSARPGGALRRETYESEEPQQDPTRRDVVEKTLTSAFLKKPPACPKEVPIESSDHTLKVGDEFVGLYIAVAKGHGQTLYTWAHFCKNAPKEKLDENTKNFFDLIEWLRQKYYVFPPEKWTHKTTEEGGKTTWIHNDRQSPTTPKK